MTRSLLIAAVASAALLGALAQTVKAEPAPAATAACKSWQIQALKLSQLKYVPAGKTYTYTAPESFEPFGSTFASSGESLVLFRRCGDGAPASP